MVVAGTGMGMQFSATNELALRAAPEEHQNMAVSSRNTAAEIGGVLGVATLGTVFQHFSAAAGPDPDVAFVAGLSPAIALGVAVLLLGGIAGLLIRGDRRPADGRLAERIARLRRDGPP
jgi:hypothetical protein